MLSSFISIREDQMSLTVLFPFGDLSVLQAVLMASGLMVLMASGPRDNWNIAHRKEWEGPLAIMGWKQWCKIAWNSRGKNVQTKATTYLMVQGGINGDAPATISATFGLSFSSKGLAYFPRISSESFANTSGSSSLHHEAEEQILFVNILLTATPLPYGSNRNYTKCWTVQFCDFEAFRKLLSASWYAERICRKNTKSALLVTAVSTGSENYVSGKSIASS